VSVSCVERCSMADLRVSSESDIGKRGVRETRCGAV
jgi:hypothetical protein